MREWRSVALPAMLSYIVKDLSFGMVTISKVLLALGLDLTGGPQRYSVLVNSASSTYRRPF